jgi:hypothetical protein
MNKRRSHDCATLTVSEALDTRLAGYFYQISNGTDPSFIDCEPRLSRPAALIGGYWVRDVRILPIRLHASFTGCPDPEISISSYNLTDDPGEPGTSCETAHVPWPDSAFNSDLLVQNPLQFGTKLLARTCEAQHHPKSQIAI